MTASDDTNLDTRELLLQPVVVDRVLCGLAHGHTWSNRPEFEEFGNWY